MITLCGTIRVHGGKGGGNFLDKCLLEHPVNLSEVHLGVGGGAFKSNEVKRLNKEGGI